MNNDKIRIFSISHITMNIFLKILTTKISKLSESFLVGYKPRIQLECQVFAFLDHLSHREKLMEIFWPFNL